MTKNEKEMITVEGKEYDLAEFTPEQANAFNHVQNLDRKIAQSQFNTEEMMGGREFWAARLRDLLENVEDAEEIAAE